MRRLRRWQKNPRFGLPSRNAAVSSVATGFYEWQGRGGCEATNMHRATESSALRPRWTVGALEACTDLPQASVPQTLSHAEWLYPNPQPTCAVCENTHTHRFAWLAPRLLDMGSA